VTSVAENGFSIAMPGEQMFQLQMARKVSKAVELRVITPVKEYEGFLIGLDQEWMRLTESETLKPVLIPLLHVTSIEETGKTLPKVFPVEGGELEKKSRVLTNVEKRDRVAAYMQSFRTKSQKLVEAWDDTQMEKKEARRRDNRQRYSQITITGEDEHPEDEENELYEDEEADE
jgi:hypothetical protein